MPRWNGALRHEIGMSLRRRGLWVAYGLLFVFYTVLLFSPPPLGEMIRGEVISRAQVWSVAGRFLVAVNVFFPVVAGILSADRMRRDVRLGVRELQESTPLSRSSYVGAKYFGALASSLFPVFLWVMAIGVAMTTFGKSDVSILLALPAAFLAITVPAFAFVVAFSLACPMVMPLPIYQILFVGYWFWANFIPPALFPTLNGTLLTPSGIFALQAFFGVPASLSIQGAAHFTPVQAWLNLGVLASAIFGVLVLLERLLKFRSERA